MSTETIRWMAEFICWLCMLSMLRFLISYENSLAPMARMAGEIPVVPAAKWAFATFLSVAALVTSTAAGTLYALSKGTPLNPFLWTTIASLIALTVCVNGFNYTYTKLLDWFIKKEKHAVR